MSPSTRMQILHGPISKFWYLHIIHVVTYIKRVLTRFCWRGTECATEISNGVAAALRRSEYYRAAGQPAAHLALTDRHKLSFGLLYVLHLISSIYIVHTALCNFLYSTVVRGKCDSCFWTSLSRLCNGRCGQGCCLHAIIRFRYPTNWIEPWHQ